MPALITHHIFGEDIAAELPAGIVEGEEELLAFLLGNQGPDPFFARFSTVPDRAAACHRFASLMQGGGMTRAFMALRDGVSHLPSPDERIGRAFALGLLGHYALDRAAHPFVIAQERALAEADESLAASRRAVHALIESDIDSWILWEKRRATTEERPAAFGSPREYGLSQGHKHLPEMAGISGLESYPVFCPIVADFYSGMLVTVPLFAKQLNPGFTLADVRACYKKKFSGPVVRYAEAMDEAGFIASNALAGTDAMEVAAFGNDERMILCSRFDNLGKGASGAAVQCINLMTGADETAGLVL